MLMNFRFQLDLVFCSMICDVQYGFHGLKSILTQSQSIPYINGNLLGQMSWNHILNILHILRLIEPECHIWSAVMAEQVGSFQWAVGCCSFTLGYLYIYIYLDLGHTQGGQAED